MLSYTIWDYATILRVVIGMIVVAVPLPLSEFGAPPPTTTPQTPLLPLSSKIWKELRWWQCSSGDALTHVQI